MAKKSNKQIKIEQANMQSDAVDMGGVQYIGEEFIGEDGTYSLDDWSMGATNTGPVTVTSAITSTVDSLDATYEGVTYSFGELDATQLDLFDETKLKEKYPALKQAWEHYQSVLEVCKTKEKEEDED
jgi:hypothetical protein